MSRVTISMKAARALLEHLDRYGHDEKTPAGRAREELRRAMEPKRKPRKPSAWASQAKAARSIAKAQKRDHRASIREAVFKRAGGQCEGPGGSNPRNGGRCLNPATDLQHVFGRGKGRMPESERNCLAACRTCHDAEGRNDPSGAEWWEWFAQLFQQRGHILEARAARKRAHFERTRASLPAAPKVAQKSESV